MQTVSSWLSLLVLVFASPAQSSVISRKGLLLCEAIGEPCISYDQYSPIGPFCWMTIDRRHNECCDESGMFQSPINIPPPTSFEFIPQILRYSSHKFEGKCENTGIQPSLKRDGEEKVYLLGLPGGRYFIENIHFHVGKKGERRQTEHLLNGRTADGEAHIVHVREDFESVREASKHPGGLLVISIFLSERFIISSYSGEPGVRKDPGEPKLSPL
ncbi:hypothetical protein LOTGIDRAFT_238084 [Lottia gigantea]|uniref:carbonic anhydrase n=1 Tax=Lottia gigantea TaxID=225164 RepID=V4B3G7_LOTGI|nr:hypothetical protein LOTGIDRAFT_238084 [Lottia gigantea]ESP01891.1 hypothetical protein LOTGIDRAFT_238084 [Lottia gigantea]